jgi:hypothetical protein
MSASDVRYPAASGVGSSSPPVITPTYSSSLPTPPGDLESARHTRCATGIRFFKTIHGILNMIILVNEFNFSTKFKYTFFRWQLFVFL